eukprot:symbB.v1.2.013047.t1/scaffold868.1/size293455/2
MFCRSRSRALGVSSFERNETNRLFNYGLLYVALIGSLVLQFQAPLLTPTSEESSAKIKAPPFIFKKSHESQIAQHATERLKCPVQGAVFVTKLVTAQEANTNPSSKKKRPRVPDLAEQEPKKAAATTKAKSKPKAKPKAASGAKAVLQKGEDETTLVEGIMVDDSGNQKRQRFWLDDVLAAMMSCAATHHQRPSPEDLLNLPIYQEVARHALEFCIVGEVVLNKKKMTQWSKVRPTLQNMILAFQKESMAAVPKACDTEEVLQKLMTEASANRAQEEKESMKDSSSSGASAASLARSILQSKDALAGTEAFVKANNDKHILHHPAFRNYMQKCRTVCCECVEGENAKKCQFHEGCSHTLTDLVGGLASTLDFGSEDEHPSQSMTPVLTCVGSAAVVQGAHLSVETTRQQAVVSTLNSGGGDGDASSAAASSKQKSSESLCPLHLFGKDAKFLLKEQREACGGWFFNEEVAGLLVTCRARYLFAACAELMCRPKYDPDTESPNRQFIRFDDLTETETKFTHMLLKHFSEAHYLGSEAGKFILHVEAAYAFQKPATGTEVNTFWRSMWADALKFTINKACKNIPKADFAAPAFDIDARLPELLPSPQSICPRTLFGGQNSDAKAVKHEEKDKDKDDKGEGQASSKAPATPPTNTPSLPSFFQIHEMHDVRELQGVKSFNVLNVLSLKSSLEAHLFGKAKYLSLAT